MSDFPENPDQFKPHWIEKPWGREFLWALTDDYAAKLLVINAGKRLSLQRHEKKEETLFVQTGPVIVDYGAADGQGGGRLEIEPGGIIHIAPGQVHRFTAPENGHVVLLEVSTPHLDDVVRLEDDYERANES